MDIQPAFQYPFLFPLPAAAEISRSHLGGGFLPPRHGGAPGGCETRGFAELGAPVGRAGGSQPGRRGGNREVGT